MKQNNYFRRILSALLLLMASSLSWANDFEAKNADGVTIYYNLINDGTEAEVTYKYSYGDEVINIPEIVEYDGKKLRVTSIGENAFYYCGTITSVSIPNSVTNIGFAAFCTCMSLTSINIPESVTNIDGSAFKDCTSLTSINIPESVTSIGNAAFYGCNRLTSINIPERVTSIERNTFWGCTSLASINIPESVTSIGESAFRSCGTLTSINIPERVTSIEKSTFQYCTSLTSINIPENVTSIGESAFDGCGTLTSINIPESVTSIGESAFRSCGTLTSINIPERVTSIEKSTFQYCTSLTSINIPESVTSIGENAFIGCKITSMNIPESVTNIGEGAFGDCIALASINIPERVTSIGARTFYGCGSLTSLYIPNSVTAIGSYAFYNCHSLTSINIPKDVTGIGERTFSGCSSLTFIDIPDGMISIGNYAFYGCKSLTTIICRAENIPTLGTFSLSDVPTSEATLYVPASALKNYKNTNQWKNFGTILPLEGEEEVTLAIDDAHYATFIAPFNVTIPANVTAYTISGIKENGETLQLEGLTGTIPANTPVVLYSNDIVNETITGWRDTQGTTYTEGLLTGVYTEIQAPSNSYVLQNQNGEVAFYYVAEGSQPAVKANRAYLTVPNANGIKAFRFGKDDETTGIQATVGDQESKAVIYDMTGRRVEKAVKGMYIIDGKKVMVK